MRNDLHSFDLVGASNRTQLALHVVDERTMDQNMWINLCCCTHLIFLGGHSKRVHVHLFISIAQKKIQYMHDFSSNNQNHNIYRKIVHLFAISLSHFSKIVLTPLPNVGVGKYFRGPLFLTWGTPHEFREIEV